MALRLLERWKCCWWFRRSFVLHYFFGFVSTWSALAMSRLLPNGRLAVTTASQNGGSMISSPTMKTSVAFSSCHHHHWWRRSSITHDHHHYHHHYHHRCSRNVIDRWHASTNPPPVPSTSSCRCFASVTGSVYNSAEPNSPLVRLFTKEGCTLCDKVKDVLGSVRDSYPHSLDQVDITDDVHRDWFEKYKYDIPVLHINGTYWTKHTLSTQEAERALRAAQSGSFQSPPDEPNAGKTERKRSLGYTKS